MKFEAGPRKLSKPSLFSSSVFFARSFITCLLFSTSTSKLSNIFKSSHYKSFYQASSLLFIFILSLPLANCKSIWWNLAFEPFSETRSERIVGEYGAFMDDPFIPTDLINCRKLKELSQVQKKICQSHIDHLPIIGKGLKVSLDECKYQLRHRMWNCTLGNEKHVSERMMAQGSKEVGFVYSLMSASVIHSIARACRNGELTNCGCSNKKRPRSLPRDWLWEGCGDNTAYGYKFSVGFADAVEREKNHPRKSKKLARMLMNLHNNEAGRRAVYAYAKPACKCHGVSGSCNLKTCWHQLPSFRETGYRLKEKFEKASEVRFNKQGTSLKPRYKRQKKLSKEEIVYLARSPNYCRAHRRIGYSGTRGRECSLTSKGSDSCDKMCCKRGYETKTIIKTEKCFCKFQYCCYVKCKTCEVKVDVTTCK